jgi:Skp family chaperone for outer membrane proteins
MQAKTLIAALAFAATSAASFAQAAPAAPAATATPRIHKHAVHQQKRIAEGVESGQLTAKETARLETREAKIASDTAAAKADGSVTPAERARLHREQRQASRAIYRQKHDAQKTAPAA